MSRQTILWMGGGAALGLLALAGWLYWAAGTVPEAYRQALAADPDAAAAGSDRMLRDAAAFAGDVKRAGAWEAAFSADDINGWLAVDRVRNHPDALPATISDPRIAILGKEVHLFCRYRGAIRETILSLVLEPYLPEPNRLAVRIIRARAGNLPLPQARLIEQITATAARNKVGCDWRDADGAPVAVFHIPTSAAGEGKLLRLEKLLLGEGQIYVSGTTTRRAKP